ncbi:VOC family protein [Fusobacterium perfoetens]|uniref:VOC family protein n=1 Tax=Fusobacterium perfoetens TaxID=852 RepID=UPI0015A561FD|nr:VOC family protein [Fusobacterium perfoetens]MCF2611815.1 VOC family protein [Fusobacterium perfoetens]
MMIDHIAIWVEDLEKMREFYCKYFDGVSNQKYENKIKGFESYFISFDGATRIELMKRKDIEERIYKEILGLAHLAFKVGSKEKVNELTEIFRKDGYKIIGEPRTTGDGYYESVILDPEGNRIELVG